MILYFSGTGNSAYVAKRLAKELQEDAIDLFSKVREHDYTPMQSHQPWIVVAPTYAWRIPHILHEYLAKTPLSGHEDIYFIMTCGGSIGNAGKYVEALCEEKHMKYKGCYPIVMPENYIALFSTPSNEEAIQTIDEAEGEIEKLCSLLQKQKMLPQPILTWKDKWNSGIVNDLFYPLFVHAKKFYTEDTCISCGKCVEVCPMNNIHITDGKVNWGKNCTHCMSCICNCPLEAIEYGKHTKGMHRYTCPK